MILRSLALLLTGVLMSGCNTSDVPNPPPVPKPTTQPATTQSVGRVEKSDEQWKKELTPMQFHILRNKGTERAFTGEYDKFYQKGAYLCAGCGLELFTSETKFDSGCGWPAFYAAKAGDRVKLTADNSHGMKRVEVTCARCDGHLGHVFDDAPNQPTGQRYCINSVSLKFVPTAKDEKKKSE